MTEPNLNYVHCPDTTDGHRMAYWQWGNSDSAHVIVCVHGLSRQGRDFDVLARGLCKRAGQRGEPVRVVCPDVAGRGRSDWLRDPSGYQVPCYAADMLALLAQLHAQSPIGVLDWVGTSMGGLIGIVVTGQPGLPLPAPVRKLVLNDVGPTLQWAAIERIGAYLGRSGQFASLQEAADAMWAISSSFGPHTAAQWLELSRHMVRPVAVDGAAGGEGPVTLHYDPAIAVPFGLATEASTLQGEKTLWELYDRITAETLLVRGALSDLLTSETAAAMAQRGPRARMIEFEGVGHAPTLTSEDQVAAVVDFLLR